MPKMTGSKFICGHSPRLRNYPRLFYALYRTEGVDGDGKTGD